ncbi:hypothetical protein ACVW0P_001687 [Mucilaginibacter sp. UYNi724]
MFNFELKITRHCEVRSNLYKGRAALYSKEIASYLAMTDRNKQ